VSVERIGNNLVRTLINEYASEEEMPNHNVSSKLQVHRALKSIICVSCFEKKKSVLFKTVTLINLAKKAMGSFFTKKEIELTKWFFDDCIVRVGFLDTTYDFYCPRGYDFNIFLNPFFHEYDITLFVYSILQEGDVFIDVGAHGGLYTILASKKVGSRGQVISVEPNPENLKFLELNLKLNKLNNVRIIPKAAGEQKQKIVLFYRSEDTALTSTLRSTKSSKCIEVETTTLDHITEEFDFVKMIKIDTEGYDMKVLKGAKRTLPKTHYLVVEQNTRDVIEYLVGSSFDFSLLTPSRYLLATHRGYHKPS